MSANLPPTGKGPNTVVLSRAVQLKRAIAEEDGIRFSLGHDTASLAWLVRNKKDDSMR